MSVHVLADRTTSLLRPRRTAAGGPDWAEVDADAAADRVLAMPDPAVAFDRRGAATRAADDRRPAVGHGARLLRAPTPRTAGGVRVGTDVDAGIRAHRGGGTPLPAEVRRFFAPRFGADLADVRVHDHASARGLARRVGARAFTVGQDIYFARGQYAPGTGAGRRLLAHELAHTLQQHAPGAHGVHRTIELRPPGRGEASAFDRRQELVDRLTATSAAVTYRLDADGRTLLYDIVDATAMDAFDRMMTGFIDAARLVPLRLITSAGRVRGAAGTFEPLTADSFITGYVDLDDLLGSSDTGFELLLAHFITERMQVPNYARRIGTAGLAPLFQRAHERGREAEATLLQDLLDDPSIRHHYDELKPDGTTFVRAFRSRDEGYRVFWVLRGHGRRAQVSITQITVVVGTRRLPLADFIAERAAAPAPAAAP